MQMILYHGSNVEVRKPVLLSGQRMLDFGNGFYTTTDFEQARNWALRITRIRGGDKSYVNVYEISEEDISALRVLRFETANEAWLKFVTENRKVGMAQSDFDIIHGPVANDQTMPVLTLYFDGYIGVDEALKRLLPQKLKDQVVFKTDKSLSLLSCKEVIEV